MFVKICGITDRADALAAIDAGARAIGFIFYERSPRHVSPRQLAPWMHEIPADIWKVGVFVDETPEQIEAVSSELGLDIAQLHGDETPNEHPRALRIWKAFRVADDHIPDPHYPAEAILLDGPGSGRTFNWSLSALVSRPLISRPLILAGGLDETNVQEAIARTQPWGVDACSGIESAPGKKDHARMKRFIHAALRS